jgi:hypothetical protein
MLIEGDPFLYIAVGAIEVYCTVRSLKLDALGSFETSMNFLKNIRYMNQNTVSLFRSII